MNEQQVRNLAIALLDDENGISHAVTLELFPLIDATGNKDIFDKINCENGRYFLYEDDADELRRLTWNDAGILDVYRPSDSPNPEIALG